MALIKFTPYGRGSNATPDTAINNMYATLDTCVISADNLSPHFGFPEKKITFDYLAGHNHQYAPLGPNSITDIAISPDGSGFYKTDAAGILCLFGSTAPLELFSGTVQSLVVDVPFADTSVAGIQFPDGVIPEVYVGIFSTTVLNSVKKINTFVCDVTHAGFKVRVVGLTTTLRFRLTYIAFGTPVGPLVWPAPMDGPWGVVS